MAVWEDAFPRDVGCWFEQLRVKEVSISWWLNKTKVDSLFLLPICHKYTESWLLVILAQGWRRLEMGGRVGAGLYSFSSATFTHISSKLHHISSKCGTWPCLTLKQGQEWQTSLMTNAKSPNYFDSEDWLLLILWVSDLRPLEIRASKFDGHQRQVYRHQWEAEGGFRAKTPSHPV